MTSSVTITIDLPDDHLKVLRAVDAAGGRMLLRDIIETLSPGTSGAPRRRFIEGSIRGAKAVGDLLRLEMLEASPLSLVKTITSRGREALASAGSHA